MKMLQEELVQAGTWRASLFLINIPRTMEMNSNWSKALCVTKLQRCHSYCLKQSLCEQDFFFIIEGRTSQIVWTKDNRVLL